MRFSHDGWLRVVFAATIALAAVFASAQYCTPLARAAESDEEDVTPVTTDYWIGVRCAELPALLQAQLDLPEGQGVLVDEVVADSPAQRAGLKAYDVIFAVDDKPVGDPQALAASVGRAKDHEVKIEYLRAGRKQTVSIKPGPRPESVGPQQQDQRSIRQWVERLGQGPAPMHFKFFHPGMVLPPGASVAPPLPDDMTVTIEKQGDKPAKITVKQGDSKWNTSEDNLDNLPAEARQFVERSLGLSAFHYIESAPGTVWPPTRRDADSRLNKRLDEMQRQLDELSKKLQAKE